MTISHWLLMQRRGDIFLRPVVLSRCLAACMVSFCTGMAVGIFTGPAPWHFLTRASEWLLQVWQ